MTASWLKRKMMDVVATRTSRAYWAEIQRLQPFVVVAKHNDYDGPFGDLANYSEDGRPVNADGVRSLHMIAWRHTVDAARLGGIPTEDRIKMSQVYLDALAMNFEVSSVDLAELSRANRQRERMAFVNETVAMWRELIALDDGRAPLLAESARKADLIEGLKLRFGAYRYDGHPILETASRLFAEKYGSV